MIKEKAETALAMNVEGPSSRYPEENLWIAVITTTFKELDHKLARMKNINEHWGCVNIGLKWDIDSIVIEINHKWFKHICSLIDRSHEYFLNKAERLKKKYGYDKVMFVSTIEMIRIKQNKL